MIKLRRRTQLREIAAEHHEVRFRSQQIGFGDRADQTAVPVSDETVTFDLLNVCVGNIREGKVLLFIGKGQLDQADRQSAAERQGAGGLQEMAAAAINVIHVLSPVELRL